MAVPASETVRAGVMPPDEEMPPDDLGGGGGDDPEAPVAVDETPAAQPEA